MIVTRTMATEAVAVDPLLKRSSEKTIAASAMIEVTTRSLTRSGTVSSPSMLRGQTSVTDSPPIGTRLIHLTEAVEVVVEEVIMEEIWSGEHPLSLTRG